jgi:hypothetical protein
MLPQARLSNGWLHQWLYLLLTSAIAKAQIHSNSPVALISDFLFRILQSVSQKGAQSNHCPQSFTKLAINPSGM